MPTQLAGPAPNVISIPQIRLKAAELYDVFCQIQRREQSLNYLDQFFFDVKEFADYLIANPDKAKHVITSSILLNTEDKVGLAVALQDTAFCREHLAVLLNPETGDFAELDDALQINFIDLLKVDDDFSKTAINFICDNLANDNNTLNDGFLYLLKKSGRTLTKILLKTENRFAKSASDAVHATLDIAASGLSAVSSLTGLSSYWSSDSTSAMPSTSSSASSSSWTSSWWGTSSDDTSSTSTTSEEVSDTLANAISWTGQGAAAYTSYDMCGSEAYKENVKKFFEASAKHSSMLLALSDDLPNIVKVHSWLLDQPNDRQVLLSVAARKPKFATFVAGVITGKESAFTLSQSSALRKEACLHLDNAKLLDNLLTVPAFLNNQLCIQEILIADSQSQLSLVELSEHLPAIVEKHHGWLLSNPEYSVNLILLAKNDIRLAKLLLEEYNQSDDRLPYFAVLNEVLTDTYLEDCAAMHLAFVSMDKLFAEIRQFDDFTNCDKDEFSKEELQSLSDSLTEEEREVLFPSKTNEEENTDLIPSFC